MSSQQLLSTTATMTQVANGELARMAPSSSNSPKRTVNPNITSLLNNIATVGRLAQLIHDQILSHDASVASHVERYEKAYFTEVYKLQGASDANNAMGREIDILRRENAKYKEFEKLSKRLNKDLVAYDARNRELDELNSRVEGRNEELEDINVELEGTIASLRDQVTSLEVKHQSPCVEEEDQENATIHNEEQVAVKDEDVSASGSISNGLANVKEETTEHLQPSLKRKYRESEEESELEQGKKQSRRRR